MNMEIIKEDEYQKYYQHHRWYFHKNIWKNIKSQYEKLNYRLIKFLYHIFLDLLKTCFGFKSKNKFLNPDGSLIDINILQKNIFDKEQSNKTRQITWPYLLKIYSPSMTYLDKKNYKKRIQIRYNK